MNGQDDTPALSWSDVPLLQILVTLAFMHMIWVATLAGRSLIGKNKESGKPPNKRKRSGSQSFESEPQAQGTVVRADTSTTLTKGSGESSSAADDEETRAKKTELIRVTEQMLQAAMDCDYETYVKLVSPELTVFDKASNGYLMRGMDFHKFFFDNKSMKQGKINRNITILQPDVKLLGEDVASIAYIKIAQYTTANETVVEHNQETCIWHRSSGSWRMVHLHSSSEGHSRTMI